MKSISSFYPSTLSQEWPATKTGKTMGGPHTANVRWPSKSRAKSNKKKYLRLAYL